MEKSQEQSGQSSICRVEFTTAPEVETVSVDERVTNPLLISQVSGWPQQLGHERCGHCGAPRNRKTRYCASCGVPSSASSTAAFSVGPSRLRAGMARRIVAEMIDRCLPLPFLAWFFPAWTLVVLAYHLLCDGTPSGRSLGKAICRLRVITTDSAEPPGLARAALRRAGVALEQVAWCLWMLLPLALLYDLLALGFLWLNPSGRRLEDYLAGTQVVTESAWRRMRRQCGNCGEWLLAHSRFCPHCGTVLEDKLIHLGKESVR